MKETPRTNLANEQFDEARARALLAEGRLEDAEEMAARVALALEGGGESRRLSDVLQTRAIALARLGRREEARAALERAVEVAEAAGDSERAGIALLTAVEELFEHMTNDALVASYERAAGLLNSSPNTDTLRRLLTCARRLIQHFRARPEQRDWENFSLREAVLRYESGIIEQALKDSGGVVSRAAQLLGMKHHNNLVSIINTRHRELLDERRPIIRRRRSIITRNKPRRPQNTNTEETHELAKK